MVDHRGARTAGRRRAPQHGRRRGDGVFGASALVLASVLALTGGAGVGAALNGVGVLELADGLAAVRSSAQEPSRGTGRTSSEQAQTGPVGPAADEVGNRGPSYREGDLPMLTLTVPPAVTPTPQPSPPPDPDAVDENGLTAADRAAGLLSRETPAAAGGELQVVAGQTPAPLDDRPVQTVRVEVEAGLAVDHALFAATVMEILNDPRGWGADGSVTFARTDGPADHRVVLASPQKVDELCAPLRTESLYSCGRNGHAALNHWRWVEGASEFDDLTVYRQYLVNHEVGHLLGHGHVECPGEGLPAPLMQQQSISVAPCTPNGWPFPDA
ncbi:DUF3152 domain-containing protein [Actinotalea sp. K2]|uniref:DUF3152 domain-containing protein n=1 Tax=Actinotalea sp. K2 TaxID=2939438 RepID=UPI0020183451|nr:DUF3152 domain-containing protein [Actinotalea sp. K2]MCL3859861.1 DUF3152 domain-containing protein [Actinotalea sp. K2]